MEHKILEITEAQEDLREDDGYLILPGNIKTFLVSTRKLEAFKEEDGGHAYGYVAGMIEAAIRGVKDYGYTSRKSSFGDCEDWYVALQPDADCQDPVHRMDVQVGR